MDGEAGLGFLRLLGPTKREQTTADACGQQFEAFCHIKAVARSVRWNTGSTNIRGTRFPATFAIPESHTSVDQQVLRVFATGPSILLSSVHATNKHRYSEEQRHRVGVDWDKYLHLSLPERVPETGTCPLAPL